MVWSLGFVSIMVSAAEVHGMLGGQLRYLAVAFVLQKLPNDEVTCRLPTLCSMAMLCFCIDVVGVDACWG